MQNLIGSYASTHSTFNLIGPCKNNLNIDSYKDTCAQSADIWAIFQNNSIKELKTWKSLTMSSSFLPICSGAKEPVKAVVQSKVGIQACEIHTENGRVYVRNHHHLRKSQEPFYINFPGMASSTMDHVNSSLNFNEQHVTEHTTVFPATASEQKPVSNPPEPDQ